MKLKRNVAKTRYAEDVTKMYEEGPLKFDKWITNFKNAEIQIK
jgi:hypothetical protein